ncbi:MAG TPA: hypothetical protein DCY89_08290 [Gammaproteobacteria bacterium]|nr:hypothetical protein [Gammaproteobacteria bacterium]
MLRAYETFLWLLSRPAFYGLWLWVRRLSSHALSMSSAARLPCHRTGEQLALEQVLAAGRTDETLVILDVGANLGHYAALCVSRIASRAVPYELHCFEPSSGTADALEISLRGNPHVQVHRTGMGRAPGEATLYAPWATCGAASSNPELGTLFPGGYSGAIEEEPFRIDTVDDFLVRHNIQSVHLLKIDVEGMEFDVIEGARKSIAAGQIRFIQFEISGATMLNRFYLRDFWRELSDRYTFHLVMHQGLKLIPDYTPHLECFAGAANYLLELKPQGRAVG